MTQGTRALGALFVLALSGCGGSSPTVPSVPVNGVWKGTARYTSATGGECFAGTYAAVIGQGGSFTVSITQAGTDVTAAVTSLSGASCTYTGSATDPSVILNTNGCTAADIIATHCPGGTVLRDIRLVTGSINGDVSGSTMTGTVVETYSVNTSGTTSQVGTLVLNSSFSVTQQ